MKERIDILLVERRLVESRTKAQWLIRNGYVDVNGIVITKPGKKIDNSLTIELKKEFPYVGRGGLKLESAIEAFAINVSEKICADIGASVGGFTDCLLKHGATKVYAIDIATDLLHPSLQCKDQVIKLLGRDVRELESLEEKVGLITIDITFATLKSILPKVKDFLQKGGDIIALVKPIFETEFYEEKKFNIIKDTKQLYDILIDLINWSSSNKIIPINIIKSSLLGKGGAIEFFIHYKLKETPTELNIEEKLSEILKES